MTESKNRLVIKLQILYAAFLGPSCRQRKNGLRLIWRSNRCPPRSQFTLLHCFGYTFNYVYILYTYQHTQLSSRRAWAAGGLGKSNYTRGVCFIAVCILLFATTGIPGKYGNILCGDLCGLRYRNCCSADPRATLNDHEAIKPSINFFIFLRDYIARILILMDYRYINYNSK